MQDLQPLRIRGAEQPPPTAALSMIAAFAPVAFVWPIYYYIMTTHGAWQEVFTDHWPMTVAMILGSFLAGSTPLGGGVVAYPVSQMRCGEG